MKEKKTTGKTLKAQLFSAVAMMLVATISLGSATYAWFINNRTVEVSKMDLTVSTSTSMMVAIGKKPAAGDKITEWTGYKTVIATDDIITTPDATHDTAGWTDMFTGTAPANQLAPVSISNRGLVEDHATTGYDAKFYQSLGTVKDGKLDTFKPIKTITEGVGMGAVKKLPLKFMSSADLDVYFGQYELTTLANLITQKTASNAESEAQATAMRSALRVAIVPYATTKFPATTPANVKPLVFQFDMGENAFIASANNTDYSHLLAVGNVFPNADNDTASTAADVPAALTAIQDEAAGKYAAVKAAATTTSKEYITDVAIQQTELPGADATPVTAHLATVSSDKMTVTAPATNAAPLFQLKKDEERRVDVYIWLEGTDKDCISAMSAYEFNLALPFAAVATVTGP
ncbi:MAG: hypothetical protein RSB55_03825 [Oscillospiraceae bacterium]